MTALKLSVECNRCGNVEPIVIEEINIILKRADRHDKPLSEIVWHCGECQASDAREAMEREDI